MNVWLATADKISIQIGIKNNIWGNKNQRKLFIDGKLGDILLLRNNKNNKDPIFVISYISGDPYISEENPWDNDVYNNLIPINNIFTFEGDDAKELNYCLVSKVGTGQAFYNCYKYNYEKLQDVFIIAEKKGYLKVKQPEIKQPEIKSKIKEGYIYIAQIGINEEYKVGQAINPDKRIKAYKTGTPHPVRLIHRRRVNDMNLCEKIIKEKLKEYRANYGGGTEFYKLAQDKLKIMVDSICHLLNNNIKI